MKEKTLFSCKSMSSIYTEYLADGSTNFVVLNQAKKLHRQPYKYFHKEFRNAPLHTVLIFDHKIK